MNEGRQNINRRKFLWQSASVMAVGAGTLVLPADLLFLANVAMGGLPEAGSRSQPPRFPSPSGSNRA
jgi:hypothetical protein